MDYRIVFMYADGSTVTKYASTETDVENVVVQELRIINKKHWSFVSVTVVNLTV